MEKCKLPEGTTIKPDGINELDPCLYKDILVVKNVTVRVSRCERCGNIEVSWQQQRNSKDITPR